MAEITAGTFTSLPKELSHTSVIDGLAVMAGRDMYGNEFEVKSEELAEYVANTQRVLNSTKDSKGKIVGLAIDKGNHDHEGGAGFITAVEADEDRGIILFTIDWSEDGIELVAKNQVRYFSATFDTENKLILGGSLTNWPGSRKPNGAYLLRPVELSKSRSITGITKEIQMGIETVPEVKPAWFDSAISELKSLFSPKKTDTKQEPTPESIRELMQTDAATIEMARIANEKVANQVAIYERQQHVVNLAAKMVGGSAARPVGLAGVRADEIVDLLMGLPMAQSQAVENLITKLMDASAQVNFAELGVGGGYARKPRVPAEYRAAVQVWVNDGKNLSAWFTQVMPDLGKAEDYNLTEFINAAGEN